MAGRTQRPRRISPYGLVDATDGTNAPAGAMAQLQNLIIKPNASGIMVPRPAMVQLATAPDYAGGPIYALISRGDIVYGFYASALFSGKDRPFRFDADAASFAPISGLSNALLPTSQPTSGDWAPPTATQVAGRVLFTHPGFSNASIGNPTSATFVGNVATGSTVLVTGIIGNGLVNGATLTGANIPASTTIVSGTQIGLGTQYAPCAGTIGSNQFTLNSAAIGGPPYPGMTLIDRSQGAAALPAGSVVTAVSAGGAAGSVVTFNAVLGATITADIISWYGAELTMSHAATGTSPVGGQTITASMTSFVGSTIKFGWLDISGFNLVTNGSLTSGSNIVGVAGGVGVQAGQLVAGTGIPANTYIVNTQTPVITQPALAQTGSNTVITITYSGLGPFVLPFAGQNVTGDGVQPGTVASANGQFVYELNDQAVATVPVSIPVSNVPENARITFSGATSLLLSNAATSGGSSALTITGGSPGTPLWGAGDMANNPLATPPVFVQQFNNRAWFGVNTVSPPTAGVVASDAGTPTQQSNANQTILFEDGVPVTAAAGLPLSNQLGGVIQALMVFQGDSNIRQLTGDFTTTLNQNALQTATGTLAPWSIRPSPRGLLFAGSDGLRLITFDGAVSDPIGANGRGLVLPFMNATTPSRIAAAYNENVYRVTIAWQPPASAQGVWGSAVRTDEFWFHLAELGQPLEASRWSGPHDSHLDSAVAWPGKSSFVVAPQGNQGVLYRSDPRPRAGSAYFELGQQLPCLMRTLLVPDNAQQNAVAVIETTVYVALLSGSEEILVTATDDQGQGLDQAYVWIGPFSLAAQRAIPWHQPLVFRQMALTFQAGATPELQFGAIALREEILGYQLPYPVPAEFVLGTAVLGGPGALGP